MKPIEYVGPSEAVEVVGLGLVERGVPVECPDELAGKAPKGEPGDKGYDPGAGLLAQPSNWQPASKTAVKKTDSQED